MKIIINERKIQLIVFMVNIDSPKMKYVNVGKTRYEIPNARNREAHTLLFSASYANLAP